MTPPPTHSTPSRVRLAGLGARRDVQLAEPTVAWLHDLTGRPPQPKTPSSHSAACCLADRRLAASHAVLPRAAARVTFATTRGIAVFERLGHSPDQSMDIAKTQVAALSTG